MRRCVGRSSSPRVFAARFVTSTAYSCGAGSVKRDPELPGDVGERKGLRIVRELRTDGVDRSTIGGIVEGSEGSTCEVGVEYDDLLAATDGDADRLAVRSDTTPGCTSTPASCPAPPPRRRHPRPAGAGACHPPAATHDHPTLTDIDQQELVSLIDDAIARDQQVIATDRSGFFDAIDHRERGETVRADHVGSHRLTAFRSATGHATGFQVWRMLSISVPFTVWWMVRS
jgi:hypothetical protein